MKYILLICALTQSFSISQTADYTYTRLELNEEVPNIKLKILGLQEEMEMADFRGKLLILDFWSTTCASCFYHFPKMEALQKEFGNQIQIVLVNVRDSQNEVDAMPEVKRKKLPKLPSIIGSDELFKLFPHEYAGYTVWIDKEGRVKLLSSVPKNNNREKIRQAIDMEEISILDVGKTYRKGDPPLYQIVGKSVPAAPLFSSLFTGFQAEYGISGGRITGQTDTVGKQVRSTYVNREVMELIHDAFYPLIEQEWETNLLGPYENYSLLNHINLVTSDTSRYTSYFIPSSDETDENWTKSRFCYEQRLPAEISSVIAKKFMRGDISRYFYRNNTRIYIAAKRLACIEIQLTQNRNSTKSIKNEAVILNEENLHSFSGSPDLVVKEIIKGFYKAKKLPYPFVFSKIAGDEEMRVRIPDWTDIHSVHELKTMLKLNGFEWKEKIREIKLITVSDR